MSAMGFESEHHEGEDFGTLIIHLGKEDWFQIGGERDSGVQIQINLYNREARELIEAIQSIADAEDMT